MKRYLKESIVLPHLRYFVVKPGGGNGARAGFHYRNGVFLEGAPISGHMLTKIRGCGVKVNWWLWESNAQVEWIGKEPRAYVEVQDEELKMTKPPEQPKRKRGRPRKNAA